MNTLRKRFSNERGFNLIELMIVIAIIGLLIGVGAIAWGKMIKAGNENAAVQTLDRIRTYQVQYASGHRGKFGAFDDLVKASGLDESFTGERPVVNGYTFTMTLEEPSPNKPGFYSITADPQVPDGATATGTRHFYTDSAIGGIKSTDENRPAKAEDSSI
ncbi:MAG: type IV pilin protein [Pyrinomonadaceae bacterium]